MIEVTVTKEMTFDCAHMLSNYDGKCANLHGHTYKVLVTVGGTQLEAGSSKGMIIDFNHLKQAMNMYIKELFDHAIIFSSREYRGTAEQELFEWAEKHNMRHYVMPYRTTAEYMAILFQDLIQAYLLNNLGLTNITEVHVKVYETPTSYSEV